MGNLPEAVRVSRGEGGQRMWVRVRADAGYFAQSLASTAARLGPGVFAVAAKRVAPLWAATVRVPADAWQQASGMLGAQIAAQDYAPAGWPPGTYTIVRRVWTSASEAGTGKGRRARTHGPTQLAADLGATTAGKYAYSYLRYLNPDRWARIPHAGRRREVVS